MPPRWCICAGFQRVETPLSVHVLMDHVEQWRPTSTGKLIERVVSGSKQHAFRRGVPLDTVNILEPGRELWILHPRGDPLPAEANPGGVQVLLLDGSWREAGAMLRKVDGVGRPVSLSMSGPSRYWLRAQSDEGRYSTIEALIFLLGGFGLHEAAAVLRQQFELHVYAGLLVRGKPAEAARYLEQSPVREAFPEVVARLHG
jgi:DTW domain-containing protein